MQHIVRGPRLGIDMSADLVANAAVDHPGSENRFIRSPEGAAKVALMHVIGPMALARLGRSLEEAADARPL